MGSSTDPALESIREDILAAAKEQREAGVSIICQPSTAIACSRAIAASAVFKPSPEKSIRACFLYAVQCAWDRKRPLPGRSDDRTRKHASLWKDDFSMFAQVVHEMVLPENENFAVVCIGRAERTGAGLAAQAGMTLESSIIEVFRGLENAATGTTVPPIQLKKITASFTPSGVQRQCQRIYGISGATVESVFFFVPRCVAREVEGDPQGCLWGNDMG